MLVDPIEWMPAAWNGKVEATPMPIHQIRGGGSQVATWIKRHWRGTIVGRFIRVSEEVFEARIAARTMW